MLFDEKYIQYFTGFRFLATERPVAFASERRGRAWSSFVPEFEVERVRAETEFERIESYPEYPGEEHPMQILARVLAELGVAAALGADQDGYPGILGYEGPALSEVTGARVAPLGAAIERMMRAQEPGRDRADPRERHAGARIAHRLLQDTRVPGATEAEASLRAGQEATLAMLKRSATASAASRPRRTAPRPGTAARSARGARGRTRSRTTSSSQPGDVLVTETSAPIWGYNAELERAMVIGPPTDEMRRLFDHIVAAQQVAFDALRPGVTCADVDGAVLATSRTTTCSPYWRQHVGHAIGLRNHEAPFLDVGDHTPVEPGMVFTIEPGLYAEGVGGFRHSDTVVVTEDGIEILTDYPRDLESLTIPIA